MVMRKLDQTAQAKANTGVTTVVILWHASGTFGCKFERNLLNWIRCAQTRTVEFASIWKLETWKSFSERIKQVCISVLLKKTNMSSHGWLKKIIQQKLFESTARMCNLWSACTSNASRKYGERHRKTHSTFCFTECSMDLHEQVSVMSCQFSNVFRPGPLWACCIIFHPAPSHSCSAALQLQFPILECTQSLCS